MKRRVFIGSLALALLAPGAALAGTGGDWYRDARPWLDSRSEEGARRARLMEEYARLHADVRNADRRGMISPNMANHCYDRLEKVARFLRHDRHLSSSEFDRRQRDLDGVARDLDRAASQVSYRPWSRR
jgi:hypothetical protein